MSIPEVMPADYDINTRVGPVILNLKCVGLIGGKTLVLEDESKELTVKFPCPLWPWIEPGDLITMLLSPTKVTVTVSAPAPPGLVINSKVN